MRKTEIYESLSSSEGREKERIRELELSNRRREIHIEEEERKNENRYEYANLFVTIAIYSLVVSAIILILSGVSEFRFKLSDAVLIAMLGTALSTIFAPVYLLAQYLFSQQKE